MPVLISMLRGVNVGSHNRIKMDALRTLYESLKFEDPQTYVQSGNVIFRTKEKNYPKLASKIQDAIEKNFHAVRRSSCARWKNLERRLPQILFPEARNLDAAKILVTFLVVRTSAGSARQARHTQAPSGGIASQRSRIYIYFPDGAGKSKLPWSQVERLFKVTGTARNWNSVLAMLQIAEQMEK